MVTPLCASLSFCRFRSDHPFEAALKKYSARPYPSPIHPHTKHLPILKYLQFLKQLFSSPKEYQFSTPTPKYLYRNIPRDSHRVPPQQLPQPSRASQSLNPSPTWLPPLPKTHLSRTNPNHPRRRRPSRLPLILSQPALQ